MMFTYVATHTREMDDVIQVAAERERWWRYPSCNHMRYRFFRFWSCWLESWIGSLLSNPKNIWKIIKAIAKQSESKSDRSYQGKGKYLVGYLCYYIRNDVIHYICNYALASYFPVTSWRLGRQALLAGFTGNAESYRVMLAERKLEQIRLLGIPPLIAQGALSTFLP